MNAATGGRIITVFSQERPREEFYYTGVTVREAVLLTYAKISMKDGGELDEIEKRYGRDIEEGRNFICLGEWAAAK